MIKLLVPTRNRPSSINALLGYLSKFYPRSNVVIADGSDDDKKNEVHENCAKYDRELSIEFRSYPATVPFFERILDAVLSVDDEFIAMGADDDYPIIDVLNNAKVCLLSDERLASVVPADVVLSLRANGSLTSRLSHSRNVLHDGAINRVKDFSYWHFATSYGVTRKALLLDRYRMMSKQNCASFIDFQIGIEDAIQGGIKALPEIGCIRTQTFEHEYFRATESLIYLRRSEKILAYRDYLSNRLIGVDGCTRTAARDVADLLVSRRIGDLTGGAAPSKSGFTESKQFRDQTLQEQYKIFYELYQEGTNIRLNYISKLRHIRNVLFSDVASSENSGVVANYEVIT